MLSFAANPQKFHFSIESVGSLEANAWEQVTINRKVLTEINLDSPRFIDDRQLRVLLEWLAKRFTRIAFPDSFEKSLDSQRDNLKKALKKQHKLFTEILIRLEPFNELAEGGSYDMHCHLLMDSEAFKDEGILKKARVVAAQLERIFEDAGIEMSECSPVSESHLSVSELKELVRLDFDHLSYRDSEIPS